MSCNHLYSPAMMLVDMSYNKLLQNTDLLFWGKLMVSIANIDLAIKGIVKGDSWQKLSNLGSALALCNSGIIDG